MERHYALTDAQLEQQFKDAILDSEVFTHEAHLRLAWIHLEKYGLNKTITNLICQLKNYTRTVGAEFKYNETVTIAAIHAVQHFRIRSIYIDFASFIKENNQLKTNFKGLINTHYRTDIFKSEQAKVAFMEPELLPFD